jgi:arylsulfatase A-like enzyme
VDKDCTKEQLINSFDNSVTYVDHFIDTVIDQVRDKKAIVFYAADHGESINEFEHLHGAQDGATGAVPRTNDGVDVGQVSGRPGESEDVCPSEERGGYEGSASSR